MKQTLAGLTFYPYNGKVADLKENDTTKHYADISAYVPLNCVAVYLRAVSVAGTGNLQVYPNEETAFACLIDESFNIPIAIASASQRFQWSNTVANDEWDVFMGGYFVSGVKGS